MGRGGGQGARGYVWSGPVREGGTTREQPGVGVGQCRGVVEMPTPTPPYHGAGFSPLFHDANNSG